MPATVPEAFVDDGPPTMPAGVEERAGDTVLAAHDDDRAVGDLHRREITGVRDVDRQRHHQRVAPEGGLDLALEALGIAVLLGRDRHHGLGPVATIGVDVGEHPPAQISQRHRSHSGLLYSTVSCSRSSSKV